MGILSDFIVADRSEAAAIGETPDRERWPSLQLKRFTVVEIGLLHFVLTGGDPDAPVDPPKVVKNVFTGKPLPVTVGMTYIEGFTCLDDRGEAWVHEVPASLVAELADAGDLRDVAAKWSEHEELRDIPPDELADILVELQRLARLARTEGKSLLLWTSL